MSVKSGQGIAGARAVSYIPLDMAIEIRSQMFVESHLDNGATEVTAGYHPDSGQVVIIVPSVGQSVLIAG